MTVENCLRLLKIYKDNSVREDFNASQKKQSLKNYEMMKAHILNSKKFRGHPILNELKPKVVEVKRDGKKSKR